MQDFYELAEAPVLSNVLCASRDEARALPRGDILLTLCESCGLVFNRAFEPERVQYGGHYENALHFSRRFQDYVEELAQQLVRRFDLRDKEIIEVGCGDGQFLDLLCRLGNNRGRGYDPSHRPERAAVTDGARVTIKVALLEACEAGLADMLVSRHVLEHIPEPVDFVRSLLGHLKDGAGVYFEVPDTMHTLANNAVWDVIYEHCLYFTSKPLRSLFGNNGYAPIDIRARYAGQFLSIQARAGSGSGREMEDDVTLDDLERLAREFGRRYQQLTGYWRARLDEQTRLGRTTVLWGAGSKGSSFLNAMDPGKQAVDAVVDVNPRLHGSFVGGTGHRIDGPDILTRVRPAMVIVANPIYLEEIDQTLHERGLDPELVALGTEAV